MGVAGVVDAIHVEGFALLPVGAAVEAIEAGDGEVTIALQEHLEPHLLRPGRGGQGVAGAGGIAGQGDLVGQDGQFHQLVEAHQAAAGALVVAALALQVIKTTGLEGGGDQGQEQGLHPQGLDAQVVGFEALVLKTLGTKPAAHRPGLGHGDRLSGGPGSGRPGGGGPSGSGPSDSRGGEGASVRVGRLRHRLDLGGERLGGEGFGQARVRARTGTGSGPGAGPPPRLGQPAGFQRAGRPPSPRVPPP